MKRHLNAVFASLSVYNYRLFFIGHGISVTGNWMQKLALAWLVLDITDSATWLGLVIAATQLPTLLLGTWTGTLADQYDKRRLLMNVAVVGSLPPLGLAVLASLEDLSVWPVLGLALVSGTADCFEKTARQSFPSDLVGRDLITNAVSLNHVVQDIGRSIGPAVGAWLIAGVGIPVTFYINSATFFAVFVALLLMRPSELWRQERARKAPGQVLAGLSYVRRTPHLFGPVLLLFAAGLMAYNMQVLLPVLARETFHGDARHAGYLLASLGVGAVVGGLAIAAVMKPSPYRIVIATVVLAALCAVLASTPTFLAALLVVALLGAASVILKTAAGSWLQLAAKPAMRGRVAALLVLAIAGTSPVGSPLLGWIADQFGARVAFLAAGAVTLAAAGLTYLYLRNRNALWVSAGAQEPTTRTQDGSIPAAG